MCVGERERRKKNPTNDAKWKAREKETGKWEREKMRIERSRETEVETEAFKRISSDCALLQRVGTVALLHIAKQIGWSDLSHSIATLTGKDGTTNQLFLDPLFTRARRNANQPSAVRIENTSSPRSSPLPLNPSVRAIVAKSADKTFQPV